MKKHIRAFKDCYCPEYDFTSHTSIPTLEDNAFYGINEASKIKVPSALYNEWIVAENWSKYDSNIVAI